MAVTIKQIAEVSGVSRGTVDRVLNHRGNVNLDTAKKVMECANLLGYTPNIAGKALAARKKGYIIGIVLTSIGNPFFREILNKIEEKSIEYEHYGIKVLLLEMKGYSPKEQLELLEELEHEVSALILTPIDDTCIRDFIDKHSREIPIITINTDIPGSKRLCYVGTDYYNGGQIAAGLVSLLNLHGTEIGIVHGSKMMYGHNERVRGFIDSLTTKEFDIKAIVESEDDDIRAYEETKAMLLEHKGINTIFVVAAGVPGVCRAIESSNRIITVITFDEVPTTIELLKLGKIKATISQQPSLQAHKALEFMFEYLVSGKVPEVERYYVNNQIKIKENYMK